MQNWNENDLKRQYANAKAHGWLPFFEQAATANNFTAEFLMAIASRETNMTNIKGDFQGGIFHGFGIMQVDIGTEPDFCAQWTPDQVKPSIDHGVKILAGKRTSLAAKGITSPQAIAAAYNTGAANVIHTLQTPGADPDKTTTGHDYGKDVLARMAIFTTLHQPVPAAS